MLSKLLGQIFGTGGGHDAAGGGPAPQNDALSPIAGITLEKFAELCAKMANTPDYDDAFAAVAEANGVSRDSWTAAREGWKARMENPATAGTTAIAYMPLYQEALAKYGGPVATATLEEYIEMSAMINTDLQGENARPKDFDAMYAKFNIDPPKWSQISTYWVGRLTKEPTLATDYAERCRARIKELDAEHVARTGGA